MGSISTADYAEMAKRVYNTGSRDPGSFQVPGFSYYEFREAMNWGLTNADFKGCVYAREAVGEAVVAFQGTVPSKGGDILSDLQIVIGLLPQYTTAAMRLFDRTSTKFPGFAISLVGHSLGGGMAQIIGHWTAAPFVTFNAPGMWGDIQKAKFLPVFPRDQARSIAGTFKGSIFSKQKATTGRNFRNVLNPVSAYGCHYGPVTRFWGTGLHSMNDILERIRKSRWAKINPFDPAYKEWGEL